MKYYKISMDVKRESDIVCHYENDYVVNQYYTANILKFVDALCLDKSQYFETEIKGIGTIYTVSKYGIYAEKTDGADVFKLANRQQIPIFVSERFKKLIE